MQNSWKLTKVEKCVFVYTCSWLVYNARCISVYYNMCFWSGQWWSRDFILSVTRTQKVLLLEIVSLLNTRPVFKCHWRRCNVKALILMNHFQCFRTVMNNCLWIFWKWMRLAVKSILLSHNAVYFTCWSFPSIDFHSNRTAFLNSCHSSSSWQQVITLLLSHILEQPY